MTTAQVLEQNLTENQRLAVLDDHRDILCLACAGSGKSRTLAFRIAYLVANGCPADSIVAFTFTEQMFSKFVPFNMRYNFYNDFLKNYNTGKDIRLYNMEHVVANEQNNIDIITYKIERKTKKACKI